MTATEMELEAERFCQKILGMAFSSVSSGLVGEQLDRLGRESAGARDSGQFAAGELVRFVILAMSQTDEAQHFLDARPNLFHPLAVEQQRQGDILFGAKRWQQIEELED